MENVRLYIEMFNRDNEHFVDEIDVTEKQDYLLSEGILLEDTTIYYDAQDINVDEFLSLKIFIPELNKYNFEDFYWCFQHRAI